MTAEDIIRLLNLEPLENEGGFYRQTYKARGGLEDAPSHPGRRAYSTAIYYLITQGSFSALHRVPQDEIFHFYLGDPVQMLQLTESGQKKLITIGPNLLQAERPQVVAPGGVWQGTRLKGMGQWALLGCTVAPGFEFSDFELRPRGEFLKLYPEHKELILRFTH